jgi:hypothetical protein
MSFGLGPVIITYVLLFSLRVRLLLRLKMPPALRGCKCPKRKWHPRHVRPHGLGAGLGLSDPGEYQGNNKRSKNGADGAVCTTRSGHPRLPHPTLPVRKGCPFAVMEIACGLWSVCPCKGSCHGHVRLDFVSTTPRAIPLLQRLWNGRCKKYMPRFLDDVLSEVGLS